MSWLDTQPTIKAKHEVSFDFSCFVGFFADACFGIVCTFSFIFPVFMPRSGRSLREKERKRVGGWMVVQFLFLAHFTYLEKDNNLCGKGCVKSIHAYIDS